MMAAQEVKRDIMNDTELINALDWMDNVPTLICGFTKMRIAIVD
jgi:hypothetical protein